MDFSLALAGLAILSPVLAGVAVAVKITSPGPVFYRQPRMGLDGRLVRLVDLDLPSCEEHQLDDDEWARIPLAAVLDPQSAVDRFTVLELGDRGFALAPRRPGGVARVEVVLRPDNLPLEVVVIDPQGATNRLEFGVWTALAQPPQGGWLPLAPAGVQCTGEGAAVRKSGDNDRGRLRR
jgi:hypothetical protein